MPTFIFKAQDLQGRTVKDRITANDSQDALLKLRADYSTILSLKEEEQEKQGTFVKSGGGKKVKLEQLAQFSRELATMANTGIPLVRSLVILGNQFKEKSLAKVAKDLGSAIESGSSFAEGLSKFPSVFPPLYINMIAAGESSGMLNEILARLATYLEKTAMLVRKVKTAMIYPATVITVAIIITSFLFIKVIPGFKNIFESFGGKLPVPTQIVVGISDIIRKYFLYWLGILLFLGVVIFAYVRTTRGKFMLDGLKLKLPVIGSLFQKVAIARFSQTLATLIRGGLPILEALDIVSRSVGNSVLENSILRVKQQVRAGQRLAAQLKKEESFPPMVVEMIGIGEETGELDNMLDKIAESYQEQVDVATAGLVSVLEPFIIIFLGVVIGGIVISMFLPILTMSKLIGR